MHCQLSSPSAHEVVKEIAVQDEKALSVYSYVSSSIHKVNTTKGKVSCNVLAQELVMIPGDIVNLSPSSCSCQDLPNDVCVRLRPVVRSS